MIRSRSCSGIFGEMLCYVSSCSQEPDDLAKNTYFNWQLVTFASPECNSGDICKPIHGISPLQNGFHSITSSPDFSITLRQHLPGYPVLMNSCQFLENRRIASPWHPFRLSCLKPWRIKEAGIVVRMERVPNGG